jgi:hypothetical protein
VCGYYKDQVSRSRRIGGRFLPGRDGLSAEIFSDRLGQSRLIHLSFYLGHNPFIILDPAFLFHEAALL